MIELHIFTNCTVNILKKRTIVSTYDSFKEVFGVTILPTIWLDKNPNHQDFNYYYNYLKTKFPESTINVTSSLSDGYIKMITNTSSDYLVVLEHDWLFLKENIKHSLDEICNEIFTHDISHLRFNAQHNFEKCDWSDMSAIPFNDFLCKCVSASNNPHIINVQQYRATALKYIKLETGSLGVEQNLRNITDCNFGIYGNYKFHNTIYHTNGRDDQYWANHKNLAIENTIKYE
jgi:hypothetical protein